jgi:predicted transcriptional regulator
MKLSSPRIQRLIRDLKKQGHGRNQIAKELHVSRKTVTVYSHSKTVKWKRRWEKRAGRPPILTIGVKRKAKEMMKNTRIKKASELTSILGIRCCRQTSQNLLRSLNAKRTRSKVRPLLTESTKQKRLAFAEAHIGDEEKLSRTVFSDEKKFSLTGPDEYQKEWRLPDSPPDITEQSQYRNESVMVWGAIGLN